MKKFASLFLALALGMGLAAPAFAAEQSETFTLQCGDSVTISNFAEKQVKTILYNGEMLEITGFVVDQDTTISFNVKKESTYGDLGKASLESDGYWDEAGFYLNSYYGWDPVQAYTFLIENQGFDMGAIYLRNPDSGWEDLEYGFDAKDRLFFLFYLAENEPKESLPAASGFTDVASDAYYADAVKWAVDQKITTGTSADTFSPENTCTTSQILTFLWRAKGSPEPKNLSAFSDVAADAYYAKAVAWAKESGMVSGDTLSPETPCTRLMAMEFMWKQAGMPGAGQAGFADVSSDAVNWAVETGVTTGTGTATFSPDTICTRSQIATFLYRAFAE